MAQFSRNKDCVHDGNIRRTNACIDVRLMFPLYRRLHRERENEVFERHAIGKIHTPMWLNWQSSWFVISRLTVRVRSSALMGRFPSGQRGQTVNLLATPSKVRILLCPLKKEAFLLPITSLLINVPLSDPFFLFFPVLLLPNDIRTWLMPSSGIEPETRGFSVLCSTNWANWALSCGNRIWTYDIRVMSPASFQTAPPRDI